MLKNIKKYFFISILILLILLTTLFNNRKKKYRYSNIIDTFKKNQIQNIYMNIK